MSNNQSAFQSLIAKIRRHPVWATAGAVFSVYATAITIWAGVSSKPLLEVIATGVSMTQASIILAAFIFVSSITTIVIVAGGAVKYKRDADDLRIKCAEQSKTIQETDAIREELKIRTDERDGARQSYLECKHNFTIFRFEKFAEGIEEWPDVTIRYADIADYPLVEKIERLIKEHTKWPVTLDQSNNPVLRPNNDYKVILVTTPGNRLMYLQNFFDVQDGRLLECNVRIRQQLMDADGHLVIEVLPTIRR